METGRCRGIVRFKNVEEACHHRGKFVAIPSLQDKCVIREGDGQVVAGENSEDVVRRAKELGHADPVHAFIPEKILQVLPEGERAI